MKRCWLFFAMGVLHLLGCALAAAADPPSVVITYEGELTEFARYLSGERYVVEIPKANNSRLIRGDFSACTAGESATIWSFPSPAGTQATLRNTPGRIEIVFTGEPLAAPPAPLALSQGFASLSPDPGLSHAPAIPPDEAGPAFSGKEFLPPILAPPTEFESAMAPGTIAPAALSAQSIALANFALDVPDSPAFAVLGISPENVVRPSNPQELVTSVLNGVDRNGNFQTGLALDTAPFLLLFGKDVTLERYQQSYITRLLTRTQLSFATSKGTEPDDESTRLALGLHLTLLDRGDPRFDIDLQRTYDLIDTEINQLRGPIPPGADMESEAARREEAMRPFFKAAFAEARRLNWNRTNWSFGAAPSWISPQGDGESFRWNGATVWTSFAYGFEGIPVLEKSSQLILHARYRDHEEVPDPARESAFRRQDSLVFGGRLRIGTVDTNASIDAGWIREWVGGRANDAGRIAVGLERRMTKNLWLSLSAGQEFGNEDRQDALTILANFKLGFGDDPAPITTSAMAATPVVFRQESAVPENNDEVVVVAPPSRAVAAARPGEPPKEPRRNAPANTRRAAFPPSDPGQPKAERPAVPADTRRAAEPPPQAGPEKAPRPASSGARRALFPSATPAPGAAPPKANRPPGSPGIRRAATPTATPEKANRPNVGGRRAVAPEE